jgi:hypothetical protein
MLPHCSPPVLACDVALMASSFSPLVLQLGLLTKAELDSVIAMVFNPVRVGFAGAGEVWTRDVLNCEWGGGHVIRVGRTPGEDAHVPQLVSGCQAQSRSQSH